MEALLKNSRHAVEILHRLADQSQNELAPDQRALLSQVAVDLLSVCRAPKRMSRDGDVSSASNGPLSRREIEVAELIGTGLTDGEIASVLGISTRTVNSHRDNLLRKLNVRSRASVATWVAQNRRAA